MNARHFISHPIVKMKIFIEIQNILCGKSDSDSVFFQNKHCKQIRMCKLCNIMFVNPLCMRLARVDVPYFLFLQI